MYSYIIYKLYIIHYQEISSFMLLVAYPGIHFFRNGSCTAFTKARHNLRFGMESGHWNAAF